MKKLFVDTSAWVAAADASEAFHHTVCHARDQWLAKGHILVTTNYVIDETLTLIRMRMGLHAAKNWWLQLSQSSRLLVEWIYQERSDKAIALFFKFKEQAFSFTDCTSFVVMDELKLKYALALDEHFRQKGFHMLPDTH